MSEGLTYRCLCPEGRQLQADGKSCNRELWMGGVSVCPCPTALFLSILDFALAVAQGCGVNVWVWVVVVGVGLEGVLSPVSVSFPLSLYPAVKVNF